MQVDSIELFHVALPLRQPLCTPAGELDSLETVLVRMQSGQTSGWGEASPGNAPLASGQWAAGALACLRDWLAPAVAGTEVDSGEQLQQRIGLPAAEQDQIVGTLGGKRGHGSAHVPHGRFPTQ